MNKTQEMKHTFNQTHEVSPRASTAMDSSRSRPTSASSCNSTSTNTSSFSIIKLEDHHHNDSDENEDMRTRIERVQEDLNNIEQYYNIELSPRRRNRLHTYLNEELIDLQTAPFDTYDQDGKVDYILLKNYLNQRLRQLDLDAAKNDKIKDLIPFGSKIISLCEARQDMESVDGKAAAEDISWIVERVLKVRKGVEDGDIAVDKTSAFRAARMLGFLKSHLAEWFSFYKGYDPLFSWWVSKPFEDVDGKLSDLVSVIQEKLVGIKPDDTDQIIGDPIGYDGLMSAIEAEMIPYTPEELIRIGEMEYVWCENEMKKAADELGYENWRDALEYVKNLYVEPGKQPQLIRELATEAIDFVKENDLVTVPKIAEETFRMFMMSPEAQKTNPFFLGGDDILVSYPTDTMDHSSKLMSMRGNNIHFARATVFHEMIPGHRLEFYYISRYHPYRRLFDTPFWIEGWSLYWEMIFWTKTNFPKTPENRIGMLFWRMHRCARIIFSIKFHLGQMTPQECIDMLVDMVGHERATAEGEVRRSFNGDYSPLYQSGYLLGALQFWALRQEVVGHGKGQMTEKELHDRILKGNEMPIELVRALIEGQPLSPDFKSSWKFYEGL